MKKLDTQSAHEILVAVHDAWSQGAIERMLSYYADDLSYWCNVGAISDEPFVVDGKQGMRTFLMSISSVAESASSVVEFNFEDCTAYTSVAAYVRHRRTGHAISGTYRQIVTFRGRKIQSLKEYHDAEKMAGFWRMITAAGHDAPQAD